MTTKIKGLNVIVKLLLPDFLSPDFVSENKKNNQTILKSDIFFGSL